MCQTPEDIRNPLTGHYPADDFPGVDYFDVIHIEAANSFRDGTYLTKILIFGEERRLHLRLHK